MDLVVLLFSLKQLFLDESNDICSNECSHVIIIPWRVMTFGSAPGPGAVSRRRTPPAAAPCPTFCEFAVAISQSRTRKEPLTKLNGPALFCSRYLNAALCFFLVGLLCQITLFLKTWSGFCDTASAQHGVRPAHSRRSVNVF